jgi:TP901-1 family phage major tail protein
MAYKGGRDLLLKIEAANSPGTYNTVGGLKTKSMAINNGAIDVTNHGSNEWKEILASAGVKDFQITGSGVFTSDATLTQMVNDCINGTLRNFQIADVTSGSNRTYQGAFKITKFDNAGQFDKEQTWQLTLMSSGAITVS